MPFNQFKRRGEEVEGFAETILDIAFVGEVQSRFAARREDDEARRAHADLRHVLYVEARATALYRSNRARRAWSRNRMLEDLIELRSRDAQVARAIGACGKRQ